MKILIYDYVKMPVAEQEHLFSLMGNQVQSIRNNSGDPNTFTEEFKIEFLEKIKTFKPDLVFNHNFFTFISDTCEKENIKYAGWTSDNPVFSLYSPSVYNKCNYIFLFDKSQYDEFKILGLKHIYYLPLSACIERLSAIEYSVDDIEKYQCEVSFVGNFYESNGYNQLKKLSSYLKGYTDALIEAQLNSTGFNILEDSLSDYFVSEISKQANIKVPEITLSNKEVHSKFFLPRKCTEIERKRTLNYISEFCNLTVFSRDSLDSLSDKIKKGKGVNYISEAPKVFKLTKINLNITLRSILTGVPLRVFDIMGNGGFTISNYQTEMNELFEIGKDIVVYYDLRDLKGKILYYLEHDNERMDIAYNGYIKIKNKHSMIDRLAYILKTVQEDR